MDGSFCVDTERLVMRHWRDSDLDDFHRLHCDPKVMATLGPIKTLEETADLIKDLQGRAERNGGLTYWALERRSDKRVIGFCGIDRGHETPIIGELEIGWRLASDCWGSGNATEAAQACLDWASCNHAGERVFAMTAVMNTASRAVMQRLGMTHLAELDFDHPGIAGGDPLRPHVIYSTVETS